MTFRELAMQPVRGLRTLGPGILLAAVIGAAATFLSEHYGGPTMLFALLIGIAFNFLAAEPRFSGGIEFSARTLLRLAVALMGLRVSFSTIIDMGLPAVAAVIGLVAMTIGSGFLAARIFGRGWRFALLTGGSVAICGASAALALSAMIPRNERSDSNTLFTVVAVTTLSTLAMILYPILFHALDFSDRQIGFLLGATIHDVAQVVGAGFSVSDEAGEIATVVKLMRVSLLPVVMLVVLLSLRGRAQRERAGIPAFVIGFVLLAVAGNLGAVPRPVIDVLTEASRILLVTAIAALGVKTSLQAIASVGGGHLGVIVFETLALAAAAVATLQLGLVML